MPAEFDSSRQYEIVFWAKNDTNLTQVGVYHQAIKDFEACYPNIHVNMKLYTNYNDIYKDVITNIPTKTTPNVCITYPDHIATYMTGKNTVVPLDSLIADTRYGLGGSAVAGNNHEVDFEGQVNLTDEIAEEHACALEDADHHRLLALIIRGDLLAQLGHGLGQLFLGIEDAVQIVIEIAFVFHGGSLLWIFGKKRDGFRNGQPEGAGRHIAHAKRLGGT